MVKKICIVGAGMAGLAAAKCLLANSTNDIEITMYEALNRTGGRAYTTPVDTEPMDWGCEALEAGDKAPTKELEAFGTKATDPTDIGKYYQFPLAGAATDINASVEAAKPDGKQNAYALCEENLANTSKDPLTASDNIVHGADFSVLMNSLQVNLDYHTFSEAAITGTASARDMATAGALQEAGGHESGTVYFTEGLGDVVQKWAAAWIGTEASGKNRLTITDSRTVTKIENTTTTKVTVTTTVGSVDFDTVLVTVPTNVMAKGIIDMPDLMPSEIMAFQNCPLGFFYKVAVSGLSGITEPAVNSRVPTTLSSTGYPVQVAQSPGGKYCYFHASGAIAQSFAAKPVRAENYIMTALKSMNASVTGTPAFTHTTWQSQPEFGGAYSHCKINHSQARVALANLKKGNIYFAGEAHSQMWYGQLAGAMDTGQKTAASMITDLTL